MGVLAGEKGGSAGRTGGAGAEILAKDDTLLSEALNIGGGDGIAVGLDVSTGVVGVDVEDVGFLHGATLFVVRCC